LRYFEAPNLSEKCDPANVLLFPVNPFAVKTCRFVQWVLLWLLCASSWSHAAALKDSESTDVTIVVSSKSGIYDQFSKALDSLLASGTISHRVIDATEAIPNSKLVIAVGMKAADMVMASDATSVINVLITKGSYTKLLQDAPEGAAAKSISAIYMDQPANRQVHLLNAILPGKHNIGILYSIAKPELDAIRQELTEHHFKIFEQKVDATHALADSLQDILLGRSEILLALPDSAVYNDSTIRNILLATYHRGIPLIGYSSGYVKAGALCAVYSTPEQIAAQAAQLIFKFKDTHKLPAPQYPQEFEVTVNPQVADSLGLQIKNATALHDEIDNITGDSQ
jgi:ABC-type uncharacterized transport system substrate-binding protein